VGGVAAIRVGEARLRLEQAVMLVAQLPLRPSAHDLSPVELLVRDALRVHRRGVVAQRDRRVARSDVEAAGDRDDRLAGFLLDLRPGVVRAAGEADVVGPVVGQPDDPAVILRSAVDVAQLELLEPQDPVTQPPAQPVDGAGADPAQADDDRVPFGAHRRIVG